MQEDVINLKNLALGRIMDIKSHDELNTLEIEYLGRSGRLTTLIKEIAKLPKEDRKQTGLTINEAKLTILSAISEKRQQLNSINKEFFDATIPGIKPPVGHLHLITQATEEISIVFEKIGFVRRRYPEVEWDFYAFESLNMDINHPARDDWETYFVDTKSHKEFGNMVLTPHTSSGQVREMRKTGPPIRMINIAKCYRRQSDVSHTPMFHQFEGLVVDKGITISHLKGTLNYFANKFFGEDRKTRLRPYNFRFTEPSFEVDISCDLCKGTGEINNAKCRLCKAGWLELGGAGMVHPVVLRHGRIDPEIFSGFAFGWGVERTFMMKSNLSIPDLRLLYSSDVNFLKQF